MPHSGGPPQSWSRFEGLFACGFVYARPCRRLSRRCGLSAPALARRLAHARAGARRTATCAAASARVCPGFATPDTKGNWTGLDVDFCRAIASAIFNDPKKVRFTPTSAKVRFTALQAGEFDVLSRNTTWTISRDVQLGLEFVGVIYYDGQGFMVPKKLNVTSAKQLNGANVCTNTGTTTELNLADYFRANNLKYKVIAFEKNDEVLAAYDAGRCDAYTTDASGLYAERLKLKNAGGPHHLARDHFEGAVGAGRQSGRSAVGAISCAGRCLR